MKKTIVTIDGQEYPCRPTMGAMLRFKRETGKEVNEITGLSDWIAYLYCFICSATKADTGEELRLSLMDFADHIAPDQVEAWAAAMLEGTEKDAGVKKKRKPDHSRAAGIRAGLCRDAVG